MELKTILAGGAALVLAAFIGDAAFGQDEQSQTTDQSQTQTTDQNQPNDQTQPSDQNKSQSYDRYETRTYQYKRSYYNTNPTPEERAQTNELNTQQSQSEGTAQGGESGRSADQRYQDQQQNYQEQLQQYHHARGAYENRLSRYEYDRSHPRQWWYSHYERATFDGLVRLPRTDLIGRAVDERDGLELGRIADVERGPDGRVDRIEVKLNGADTAWVGAQHLRYDWDDHIMFTDVPADALYERAHEVNPRP